ncbi:hypothetical protein [Mycobacteroides chelonae]|uniref:hypothetical protein n=1 Tax=Mycobacteroides chelonae TaxID=1774 RepID=UPI0009925324|nr:hypothetical protein [Mycobacteroides chelonae]
MTEQKSLTDRMAKPKHEVLEEAAAILLERTAGLQVALTPNKIRAIAASFARKAEREAQVDKLAKVLREGYVDPDGTASSRGWSFTRFEDLSDAAKRRFRGAAEAILKEYNVTPRVSDPFA